MAKIKICFSEVKAANDELRRILKQLDQISDDIQLVKQQLDPEIQARRDISARLTGARKEAVKIREQVKKLHMFVDDGVMRYQRAEASLSRGAPDSIATSSESRG